MQNLTDHPQRYAIANELHARPFPTLSAPGFAAYLAIIPDAQGGDAGLVALKHLLDRHGAPHPQPGATHYAGQLGKHHLKWEQHTEFVTFTLMGEGRRAGAFDAGLMDLFPADWQGAIAGRCITKAIIHIDTSEDDAAIIERSRAWFVPESLAISRVLEDDLVIAGDFQIDPAGQMRFAVFARAQTGAQRIGRVLQRICEIETYKAMAMLGLTMARDLAPRLSAVDQQLVALTKVMQSTDAAAEVTLDQLLDVSAGLEDIASQSAYRFAATTAYQTIVDQRIAVLREERFNGRQTFAEFMMRRFDPAMRTVASTQARLANLTARAERASHLLRTRVDVDRSAQNQNLLISMNTRADQQLRLQQTVEGLSVVAISYYAVNLMLYLLGPLQALRDWPKSSMAAVITPVVVICVWLLVRRIRRGLGH